MTKQELRKIFLKKRVELSDGELEVRSKLICENFFSKINLDDVKVLHTFLPIYKHKEPDTWYIIRKLNQEYPEVQISIPRVNSITGELDHIFLNHDLQFSYNQWGIPEPIDGTFTQPHEIDVILVPLLTFDTIGNRVGYGKGFYDKFLATCRADTIRIGISLFEGVSEIQDIDTFDQPLHYCITPYEVINF